MAHSFDVYDHFANEGDYPDFDYEASYQRLAAALACKTVFDGEKTDFREFERLQDHIRRSFPHIFEAATFELIGHSVLICVPGSDPALEPAMLIAHQDVVPVIPGTEDEWVHDAFSGHIDDEWIWGRGALDIKDMLMAELEATEYLLATGKTIKRGIYLAFGEDEEVSSHGATRVAAAMAERGMRAAFLLDEGTTTMADAADYGAPNTVISDICLSQKGYLNLKISIAGAGGHSSNPFGGTSLEKLSRAVAALCENRPAPQLTPLVAGTFEALRGQITEKPFSALVDDVEGNAQAIADAASQVRSLYPFVATTVAVDQVFGSSPAANVMPADVAAVVNFRLLPGCDVDALLADVRRVVAPFGATVEKLHYTPAGRVDSTQGAGYAELKEALEHFHPGVVFVPSFVCGGTDSVRYEGICDSIMRICPFRPAPQEEARGVHGVNERISKRCYAQGTRVLIRFLEATCL